MVEVAGHPGNGDDALLWVVFALVLVLLLVVLVSLVLDYYHRSNEPQSAENVPPSGGAALEILDTRYASGELTRRDYLQARKDLLGAGEGPAPAPAA
jgi:uncharacterized membrane protein